MPPSAATDAASSSRALGESYFVSHDTEGFSTNALAVEYLPEFRAWQRSHRRASHFPRLHPGQLADANRNRYRSSGRSSIPPPPTAGKWMPDFPCRDSTRRSRWMAATTARWPRRPGLDLFINRDWVETRAALDRGIDFTFFGGSIDQGIGEHWTVVGVAGLQYFSDSNSARTLPGKTGLPADAGFGLDAAAPLPHLP